MALDKISYTKVIIPFKTPRVISRYFDKQLWFMILVEYIQTVKKISNENPWFYSNVHNYEMIVAIELLERFGLYEELSLGIDYQDLDRLEVLLANHIDISAKELEEELSSHFINVDPGELHPYDTCQKGIIIGI